VGNNRPYPKGNVRRCEKKLGALAVAFGKRNWGGDGPLLRKRGEKELDMGSQRPNEGLSLVEGGRGDWGGNRKSPRQPVLEKKIREKELKKEGAVKKGGGHELTTRKKKAELRLHVIALNRKRERSMEGLDAAEKTDRDGRRGSS